MNRDLERLRMALAAKRRAAAKLASESNLDFHRGMAAAFEEAALALLDKRTLDRFCRDADAYDPAAPFPTKSGRAS